jgi:hypothetical protein
MVPLLLLLLLLNPHILKTFHSDLLLVMKNLHPHFLVILKTQKNASPLPQDTQNIPSPPTLNPEKKQKNLHPHILKRHQILHPHHYAHHLLLLLLMKQQNLHPQMEELKTIIPKQVHLDLIPL